MKTNAIPILMVCLLFAGCSPTSTEPTAAPQPASDSRQVSAAGPKHFWFDYPFEPAPGKRYWTLVDSKTWIEQYESGEYSLFTVAGRAKVGENAGTLVVKISGDPGKTWTGNEGNFQVFIPDVGSAKMELWFRHKVNGQWQQWGNLAELQGVE